MLRSGNLLTSEMNHRCTIERPAKAAPAPAKAPGASAAKNLIRGRFKTPRLPEVEAFSASLPFDRRLFRHDIRGSIAHARMLARVGLLKPGEARAIAAGLEAIEQEIAAGRFHFDLADEDIHLAIERRLIEKIGGAGRPLGSARTASPQTGSWQSRTVAWRAAAG